jgi:hypothetical protein
MYYDKIGGNESHNMTPYIIEERHWISIRRFLD